MKKFDTKWAKYIGGAIGGVLAGFAIMFGGSQIVYPAISQLVGLSVAQSATIWNNVVDAAKGDSLSSGILGQSPYVYNGVSFDRVRGDTTNGMDVDVTRMSGSITPADAYANPTTANQIWSLNGVFNGTTWDRQREPTADAMAVTGLSGAPGQMFNGSTWDRIRGSTIQGTLVDPTSNAVSNITTNASTVVKASTGRVNRVHINVIGTTSNVRLFNDASAPCDTGFVAQIDTAALTSSEELNHTFTTGICALTAGAAAADISVLFR